MLAAIYIAECSAKEEKEDSEVFALVHHHTRKSVNDMILLVEGGEIVPYGRMQRQGRRKKMKVTIFLAGLMVGCFIGILIMAVLTSGGGSND